MSDVQFNTPLLQHYQAMLNALAFQVDENGFVYSKKVGTDVQIPTTIENRRLALPTEKLLSKPDWDVTVAFHPFSESVVRGESEMITWMKNRIGHRMTALITMMLMHFSHMASDNETQKKLTTDQLNIIQTFGDADEKTVETVGKLVEAIVYGKGQVIHFYLRHSGKTGKSGEKTAKRFCKVTFPLYKELEEENAKVYGVALRVKDRKFLKAVLEYIFDKIATEDAYSYGSNSDVAPYYHALMNGFAKVAIPVSSRIYLFRKHMENIANSRIHTEGWLDTFQEAAANTQFIPALPFNVGVGGQGIGNDNAQAVVGAQANAAIINNEPAPEVKTNQALSQIPQAASALQQMINTGAAAPSNQPTLGTVINQGLQVASLPNNVLGGLPRKTSVGQSNLTQSNAPTQSLFAQPQHQQPQQSIFGHNQGLGNQGLGGLGGSQNQGGNFNPLGGLPRKGGSGF